ncbi:hypothetical protein AC578_9482 [Pseudocercospora eumusae]|uniref:Glycosyl transferase CAP10 domain-containing protein n=1 Tax=Pseudocercospora eumusae TaxID=321146 RepID=A0A139GXV1_9PEZI|nr:hypothetical protein AC578_9482 [Pseudocercospora eumusae]
MEHAKWPALSGLVIGTILLTRHTENSFAFDRPIHSAVSVFASAGAACVAVSRWLPRGKSHQNSHNGQQYDALPLNEVGEPHASRQPSPAREHVTYASSLRKLRIAWLLLVVALCLRAEITRQVVHNVQCAGRSWEPLVPLAFAVWDYWTVRRKSTRQIHDDAGANTYELAAQAIARAPYVVVLAVALISAGGMLALASTSTPHSTYICAASLSFRAAIPHLQHFGTILDIMIVACIGQLMNTHEARGSKSSVVRFASAGWAFLFSAGFWIVVGLIYWFVQETGRKWLLTIPDLYFWSVLRLDIYTAFTLISALASIIHVGILTTATVVAFTSLLTITTASAWINGHPFPPNSFALAWTGIGMALAGVELYFQTESLSEERSSRSTFRKFPAWLQMVLLSVLIFWTCLWVTHKDAVNFHPIDMLIYEAQSQHQAYLNQSTLSTNLPQAIHNYQVRYHRQPPPGFDAWYEYAINRSSAVIDDFDSIHRDLLPFYALTPEEIRERTWAMISLPWNDAAGIMVRNHQVTVAPNVPGTHQWMLDGLIEMIKKFAEHLPDMDLAFNLNDECRVSVPHEHIEAMRREGESFALRPKPQRTYTSDRAQQWKPIPDQLPDDPERASPLTHLSWQKIFHRFGNNACPANSPARKYRKWDTSSLCTSCTYPHSLGAFLANWTLAADVCHQPDLADLHGLYLSPAAFKGSHRLYPIFSQSKAGGFNDILYPSAWNYMDKAKYAPNEEHPDLDFSEKQSKLFWRGATSEGVSHGNVDQWRGMTRQRFIHLANDINGTNPDMPLLLPSEKIPGMLEYKYFPTSTLTTLLATDVHIVDGIARCFGRDCEDQAREFAPLVPPSDFQDHWKYKYLLDLDGAGFSGRFLPFLQSKSLPFKAALFREWWDDRVTPWAHFVPLDLRGHGFWATLAYFAGIDATNASGKELKVPARQKEAERIATQGKKWAETVLRKEDMEIYFFRLLLEWARLTDDKRNVLGFALE